MQYNVRAVEQPFKPLVKAHVHVVRGAYHAFDAYVGVVVLPPKVKQSLGVIDVYVPFRNAVQNQPFPHVRAVLRRQLRGDPAIRRVLEPERVRLLRIKSVIERYVCAGLEKTAQPHHFQRVPGIEQRIEEHEYQQSRK
jgi:hypothetical protein